MVDPAPNILPFMRFDDADAALDGLPRAFGFEERVVNRNDEGIVDHAEMSRRPGTIMFGPGDPASQGVYFAVGDAHAQYMHAKAAGAEITRKIEDTDYGSREYTATDLEGQVWTFGTYLPEAQK